MKKYIEGKSKDDLKITTSPRENLKDGAESFSMKTISPSIIPDKPWLPGLSVGCIESPWVLAMLPTVSANDMETTRTVADLFARTHKNSITVGCNL
jgi:hypothetical protein